MCCYTSGSLISLRLLRLPYSLRHKNIEIGLVFNNLKMTSQCSNERNSYAFLILKEKLKINSEDSRLKTEIKMKCRSLVPVSQVVNAKENF